MGGLKSGGVVGQVVRLHLEEQVDGAHLHLHGVPLHVQGDGALDGVLGLGADLRQQVPRRLSGLVGEAGILKVKLVGEAPVLLVQPAS
jgi:hypothetical protein